jgi:putative inorganic carbon (HCO3(-)) transporter
MLNVFVVFIAVLAGIGVYVLAPSKPLSLIGLVIIGLAFVLSTVRAIKLVLLAIVILEMPIQLDVYLGHDPLEAARASLSGYNFSLTTIALAGLYAIWMTEAFAGVRSGGRALMRASFPAIVYLGVILASVLVATEPRFVFYEFVIVLQAVLILVYVGHAVRSRGELLFVAGLIIVGVLLQVGLASLAYSSGSPVRIGSVASGFTGARLAGTIGHANSLGGYLAMVLPLTAALAIAPVARWFRVMAASAFVAGTVLLGLSGSRGAFVGFMVALALLAIFVYRHELVSRKIFLRTMALAAVPLFVQLALMAGRLAAYDNDAATGRLPLIALAIDMIGDNLLLGVGANNFATVLDQYLSIDFSTAWISTVHNRYLLVWAETGIIGLIALLTFLVSTLRRGVTLARTPDTVYALASIGLLAGVAAAMVHMLVELYHSRPLVQMLWLLAGLLIAIEASSARERAWLRRPQRV